MLELILFVIAIATVFALLISLLHMNWLIIVLYDLGLGPGYEWASSYYLTLRIGFALLGILVITSLSMVILYRKILRVKVPDIERARYSQILTGVAGHVFLLFGALALVLSVINEVSILALIGLGLTFWGVLLFFIKPVRYVRSSLLDSTGFSSLVNIDRVITDLRYRGRGVYLPPRYLRGLKGGTVFIPSEKGVITPNLEEVAQGKVFLKNPEGICFTAPGLGLVNLFERGLGTSFAKADLDYLQKNLPKLFVEEEMAEDFEMNVHDNAVHVKITESVYKDLCNEVRNLPNVFSSIGCPLCSSIACALARATGEPVIIENNQVSEGGKVIEAHYRTLETVPPTDFPLEEQTEAASEEVSMEEFLSVHVEPSMRNRGYLLPNLVGLVLAALGSCILVWVGWLTWYEITTWSKSLALIFFGPRTGETISLGVGMKVLHYFLISLVLLLSSSYVFFRKRRRKV